MGSANYLLFQRLFDLPDTSYGQLWVSIIEHFRNEPDDSVGLAGPSDDDETRTRFLSWVETYFDSGISQRYWGPETPGKWKLEKDRDSILDTFKSLLIIKAHSERQKRQRKATANQAVAVRKVKHDDDESEYGDHHDTESDDQSNDENRDLEDEFHSDDDGDLYHPPSKAIKSNSTLHGRHAVTTTSLVKYDTKYSPAKNPEVSTQHISPATRRKLPSNPTQKVQPSKKRRCGRPKKEDETLAGAAAAPVTPGAYLSLSSIKNYVLEGSSLSKSPRKLEPTPEGTKITRSVTRRNKSALTLSQVQNGSDRVFQTRLGNDKTIVFLFTPPKISFQDFCIQFCKSWRKSKGEMEVEDIDVKVSISGRGEYRLSFGEDRERSWAHIMKIAEGRPESDVVVTVSQQTVEVVE